MPTKRRGSGFTRYKTGRYHKDRGGAGRGFIAGRSRTPDLLVGELRSPSPSNQRQNVAESPGSACLSPSPCPSPQQAADDSLPFDDSNISVTSCNDSVLTNDSTDFMEALVSDSENEVCATGGLGVQYPSMTLIEQTLSLLHSVLPNHWRCIYTHDGFNIIKLSIGNDLAIQRNILITCSGSVRITVHRKPISPQLYAEITAGLTDCVPLTDQSQKIFVDRALAVVLKVRSFEICSGVDSETNCDMWSTDNLGYVDYNPYGESRYSKTFRGNDCSLLVDVNCWRCTACKKANERLRVRFKTFCKEDAHEKTRNDYLTPQQCSKKMKRQQKKLKIQKEKIDYLKQVKLQLDTEGVTIDTDIGEHLTEILRDADMNPMQHVFLQQQLHYSSLSDKRGMRWHPAMIRFALMLRSVAGIGGYDAIRESGVIKLPHDRTLFDYSHTVKNFERILL